MEKQAITQELREAIGMVMHPAINFPLIKLGIIREYRIEEKNVFVTFALPFPNIPIKDMLVNSVEEPINSLGYSMEFTIDMMTDNERENFLTLENSGWKGM